MMIFRIFFSCIFLFLAKPLTAQRVVAEIDIPKGMGNDPRELQVLALQDSLFFAYENAFTKKGYKPFNSLLILPTDEIKTLPYDLLEGKILCGVVNDHGEKLFYFLQAERKSIVLKGARVSLRTDAVTVLPESLELRGSLIGTDVRDNFLFIYAFEKKTFKLKVTKVSAFSVIEEKEFPISVDFSRFKHSEISFLPENVPIGSGQASAKVKVLLQGENIAIVVDEPFDEYLETHKFFKTTVIRINTMNGEVRNRLFLEPSEWKFRSAISNDYLFRVVAAEGFVFQIFDLKNGNPIFSKVFPADNSTKEITSYFREGRANRIAQEKVYNLASAMGVAIPYVVTYDDKIQGKLIVLCGTYYDAKNSLIVLPFSAVDIMVSVIGTAILQMRDGPGISRYFYMEQQQPGAFAPMEPQSVPLLKQKIDAYEMSLIEKLYKYKVKGYYEFRGGLLAIYFMPELDKLRLVEFTQ
jgi:hypothetical protein